MTEAVRVKNGYRVALYERGAMVWHRHFPEAGVLVVARASCFRVESGREPEYELHAANAKVETIYDDVLESDLAPVVVDVATVKERGGSVPVAEFAPPAAGGPRPMARSDGPGRLVDVRTGEDLGPASYEQRRAFDDGGRVPMRDRRFTADGRSVIVVGGRP